MDQRQPLDTSSWAIAERPRCRVG